MVGGNDYVDLAMDETTTRGGTTGAIHSYLYMLIIDNKEDRVTGVIDDYRNERCHRTKKCQQKGDSRNHTNMDMEQRRNKPKGSFDLYLRNLGSDVELKKKTGTSPPGWGGRPRRRL